MELLHVPGSQTTRDRLSTRIYALKCVAFQKPNLVGIPDEVSIAAQWLACASPYRRFTFTLASNRTRLGVDVACWAFIVEDSHLLLLTGRLPAHRAYIP
jgi:hypothetical protein